METVSTTTAVTTAAKLLGKGPSSAITRLGRTAYEKTRAKYFRIFDSYLKYSQEKTAHCKNILSRNDKLKTLDQYVSVNFSRDELVLSDENILDKSISGEKFIIVGHAGAGKTMFTKWLTLRLLETQIQHQLIPLFIELRELDFSSDKSLEELIFDRCTQSRTAANRNEFKHGLTYGYFFLILDAVDEIAHNVRERALLKITRFIDFYPDCSVLLTSRKNTGLESTPNLTCCYTVDMTIEQVINVIQKSNVDLDLKNALIDELADGLYFRLKSFVSNPLLVSVMLLTYSYSGQIPDRMSLFYSEAFDALYNLHDTMKGVSFKRSFSSGLDKAAFGRFFSTFCFLTFSESMYEFDDASIRKYIDLALKYCDIECRIDDLLLDLMEAVCLIQKDGLVFVFIHRSFQEYFSARFLQSYGGNDLETIIATTCIPGRGDTVLRLLKDINADMVDFNYVLPQIKKWIGKYDRIKIQDRNSDAKRVKLVMEGFSVTTPDYRLSSISTNEHTYLFMQLHDVFARVDIIKPLFEEKSIFSGKIIPPGALEGTPLAITNSRPFGNSDETYIRVNDISDWVSYTNIPERVFDIMIELRSWQKEIEQKRSRKTSMIETLFKSKARK